MGATLQVRRPVRCCSTCSAARSSGAACREGSPAVSVGSVPMSLPKLLPPQAVLLRQRQLQACDLRPGDAVLVPRDDKQNDRRCYCVCVAWPDDRPEFGTSSLAQAEHGCNPMPSVSADRCIRFDTNSFDPCVMLSNEAQVAAVCNNSTPPLLVPTARAGGAGDTSMLGACCRHGGPLIPPLCNPSANSSNCRGVGSHWRLQQCDIVGPNGTAYRTVSRASAMPSVHPTSPLCLCLQLGRLLRSLVLCCGASIRLAAPLPRQPDATVMLIVKVSQGSAQCNQSRRLLHEDRLREACPFLFLDCRKQCHPAT
jgi:hypothetical protein